MNKLHKIDWTQPKNNWKSPEVDWSHPLMGANPFMMAMTWQIAAAKTLMEAHQKKVETFMRTGVWK